VTLVQAVNHALRTYRPWDCLAIETEIANFFFRMFSAGFSLLAQVHRMRGGVLIISNRHVVMDSSWLLRVWCVDILNRFQGMSLLQRKVVWLRWEVRRAILVVVYVIRSNFLMWTQKMRGYSHSTAMWMHVLIWSSWGKRI
jgi:hypothetical protein